MIVHLFEVTENRGDQFEEHIEIPLYDLIHNLDFAESMDDLERANQPAPQGLILMIDNLFYNASYSPAAMAAILEKVKNGETVVECWEEGVTGIGIDDTIESEVHDANYACIRGKDWRCDVSDRIAKGFENEATAN